MIKRIFIVLFVVFFTCFFSSQKIEGAACIIKPKKITDTLNYLKQFEINKANYINQPFSKLLNDMTQIQPKTAWAIPNFKTKHYNFSTHFNFCDKEFSFYNVITLSIEWQTPIPRNDTKYYEQLNNAFFTNDEKRVSMAAKS